MLLAIFFAVQIAIVTFFDKGRSAREAQRQAEEVVTEVAKLYDVPVDEEPTLATVSNPQKLSGQEFFAKAQNGDRVLFYPQSKKAILYRPSAHKIIEVSTLSQPASTE